MTVVAPLSVVLLALPTTAFDLQLPPPQLGRTHHLQLTLTRCDRLEGGHKRQQACTLHAPFACRRVVCVHGCVAWDGGGWP